MVNTRPGLVLISTRCVGALVVLAATVIADFGCETPPRVDPVHDIPLAVQPPDAVGMDARILTQIDGLVEAAIQEKRLPGAVVLVGRRGSIVWRRAYGHRALQPEPEPMTVDTIFDLASLTKVVATAASVMRLADQGLVDLSANVTDYMPAYGQNGKAATTLEHLLTHTAGLIPDNPIADYDDGPARAMTRIHALSLTHPIGSRFRYTDVGYIVLGDLVRRVSGQTLDVFAQRELFRSLGMVHTRFNPPPSWWPHIAPQDQRDDRWIRGAVHDPRAYRLGGVAGHAGLFATADDLARFAQMILNHGKAPGTDRTVLSPEAVQRMTHVSPGAGHGRGLGFDVQSAYSSPRGDVFPVGSSFGHSGFTGTSLWISPQDETFVIFLSNRLHPNGKGSVIALRRNVATVVASAIRRDVRPGIDVLERDGFAALRGRRVGLITNHTGRNRAGRSTAELLAAAPEVTLVAILSPEHGLTGTHEGTVADTRHAPTDLPVFSLYGETRRPTPEMLAGLDTLVFDIQDIGTRFYTYVSTMGYAMEAAKRAGVRFVVLDRPNPISGLRPAGPTADADALSFVAYYPLPVRHGMTVGELARLFNTEGRIGADLHVVPIEGWRRGLFHDATGLAWINPSPNIRNLNQAILYPGIGLIEATNLSVGRGTDSPFEHIGAPWIDADLLAREITGLNLPGVRFSPTHFTPTASKYADQPCHGVRIHLVNRYAYAPVRTGLALARLLRRRYPDQWQHEPVSRLLANRRTRKAWLEADSLDAVAETWADDLKAFRAVRARYLLYD